MALAYSKPPAIAEAAGMRSAAAQVASPDGTIVVSVKAGAPLSYAVTVDGKPLLDDSRLGLVLEDGLQIGKKSEVVGVGKQSVDRTWHNDFGKCSEVRDRFNEMHIKLKEEDGAALAFDLIVRAYDDGVAIRYGLPEQDRLGNFSIICDETSFTFPADAPALGGAYSNCAENHYPETRLAALPESRMCLPVVAQCPAATVALAEAGVRDWACSFLKRMPGPSSGPVTLKAELASHVASRTPRVSPWHLVMIGRKPGNLIESNIMLNLAEPSQVADTSWIKPGIMAWDDWWTGTNPFWKEQHGLYCRGNTASHMMFQDFASEMGWPYQLVDWFWYDQDSKDPETAIKPQPHIDMPALFKHAKEKNVRLILWVNSKNIPSIGAEKLFSTYESWGAAGVKIDFFNDNGSQKTMRWQEELLECAAKHHLLVDFHGTGVPTGLARTWPNFITQEGVMGNEFNKCGKKRECDPVHVITLPFTRCLLGPADFTPGGFVNVRPEDFRMNHVPCQVMGTRARQLALATIIDSPALCLSDSPANYRGQPGVEFLRGLPTVWDETRVLEAELAKSLVIARRAGCRWYLAAMNGEEAAGFPVSLGFLGKGKWAMCSFADQLDSQDYRAVVESKQTVDSSANVKLNLCPAGGFAAVLERAH